MGRKRIGPGAPASVTEAQISYTDSQHTGFHRTSQAKPERGMA